MDACLDHRNTYITTQQLHIHLFLFLLLLVCGRCPSPLLLLLLHDRVSGTREQDLRIPASVMKVLFCHKSLYAVHACMYVCVCVCVCVCDGASLW